MNKHLIFTIAALAATSMLFAQPKAARYQPTQLVAKAQSATVSSVSHISRAVDLTEGANTDIRTVAGNKVYVTVTGLGFIDNNGLKPASFDMCSDIVYGDDGFIYLHSPLGGTRSGYVKGVPAEDGRSFTVQYPQVINTVSAPDQEGKTKYYPVYAGLMECFMEEDEYGEYATYDPIDDPEQNLVTYTIDDNGTVRMDPAIQEKFNVNDKGYIESPEFLLTEYVTVPSYVAGTSTDSYPETLWLGPGCINVQYNTLPEDILQVKVPQNLQWENSWIAKSADGSTYSMRIAFNDDKVYIGGLSRQERVTSDVFMGYIDGENITFPARQFLGYDELNHEMIFLMSATAEIKHDPVYNEDYLDFTFTGKDYTMKYDPAKGEIQNIEKNGALLVSASYLRSDYFFTALYEPLFADQNNDELNAAPVAPRIVDWADYSSSHGVYMLAVNLSTMNVNGAMLDESRMYYTVFVDDEPYEFDGVQNGFDHNESLIPFDAEGKDIFPQGPFRSLYLHVEKPQKVGITSYYLGSDDRLYASRMVQMDVSGITDVQTDNYVVSREYFDMTGRKVSNPDNGGFLIEVTTFGNGTTAVKKITTSRH